MFSCTHGYAGSSSRHSLALRWAIAATLLGVAAPTFAQSVDDDLDTIFITAKRADRISDGATGLNLELRDTPQSISLITAEQMEDFGANDITAALRLTTGVNVEQWETNRTNFTARGFEVKSTQVDGVGLPNDWGIVTGAMDAFGYEKIEVVRGANGLLTGIGNASGTINYVRKRPTNEPHGGLNLSGGSWNQKRVEFDYSSPLTEDGSWAARVAVAAEDRDSWVRGLSNERVFAYGVVDGQIGERSTVTIGYSHQDANTDGNMWGGLILAYNDGTQAKFGRSASTAQDWARWDTLNRSAFIEYTFSPSDNWDLKATYNFRDHEAEAKLFYVYPAYIEGQLPGIDRDTGLGLAGLPGNWPLTDRAHLFDLSADGAFELWGRTHQATFGVSHSRGKLTQYMRPFSPDPALALLPAFPFAGDAIAEPVWGDLLEDSVTKQRLQRIYGATRVSMTDKFAAIVGFNWAEYRREGHSSGVPYDQTEKKLSPYAGLTYELFDNALAYVSYSDIYQPQDYYDINGQFLAPSKGVNYEAGIKAEWLDGRVLTTLAYFLAEQKNLGTYAGMTEDAQYYYEGVDIDSRGIEFEISGRLTDNLDLILGFTKLELEDPQGDDIYEWVPRETANLTVSSKLPGPLDLTLGLSGRWQSDVAKLDENTGVTIKQPSYVTANVFARWDISDQLYVRANLDNITDENYILSLYQVGFYGAPRNYSVTFGYDF
jgi:outer membrane receptor for ferric coprogen and ferric-rhodotorulic acid